MKSTKPKDCPDIPVTAGELNGGWVLGADRKGEGIFTRGMINDKGMENNR
jgi:hypothetical protein